MHRTRRGVGLRLAVVAIPFAMMATAAPTLGQSETAEGSLALSEACADRDALPLRNPGRLTLSTDIPAFPPWWGGDPDIQYPNEPEGGSGWAVSDPYSGEGYEAAVAYAVAAALGFDASEVDWIQNTVFENAFQPGPKAFDWHMAQVSIRAERAEAVDFSDPYFGSNQSLLAMTRSPITEVTTIEGLKDFRLGAAVATTSFAYIENVIQPNTEIQVLSDNAAAVQALQNEQIDGLVVDLYTAFYMRDAQLEDWDTPEPEATIVGQFGGEAPTDQMGMVLEKDSPLTACVNEALAIVRESGELDRLYDEWISTGQSIPYFE
jgi:polar amino acid transport system substrate-binding protein